MTRSLATEDSSVLSALGVHLDSPQSLHGLMGFLNSTSSLNTSNVNKPASGLPPFSSNSNLSATMNPFLHGGERGSVQPVLSTYPPHSNLQSPQPRQSQLKGAQQSLTQHSLLGSSKNHELDQLAQVMQQKQHSQFTNSDLRANQLFLPGPRDTEEKGNMFQPMQLLIQVMKTQYGTSIEIQQLEHILMQLQMQPNMSSTELDQMTGAIQQLLQKLITHFNKLANEKQIPSPFTSKYLKETNQSNNLKEDLKMKQLNQVVQALQAQTYQMGQQRLPTTCDLDRVNQMGQGKFDTQFNLTENQQPSNLQLASSPEDQEIDQLYSILQQVQEVVKTDSSISATELSQLEQILEQLEKQLYSPQTEPQQTHIPSKLQYADQVHQQPLAERTMSISELNEIVTILEQLQHVLETQPNTVVPKSRMLTQITELLQLVLKTLPVTTTKETDKLKQALLRLPHTLKSLPYASKAEVQQLTIVVQELFKSHFSNDLFSNQSPIQHLSVVKEFSSSSEEQQPK